MKKLKDILDGFNDKVEIFILMYFSLIIFSLYLFLGCDLSSTPAYGVSLGLIYKEALFIMLV